MKLGDKYIKLDIIKNIQGCKGKYKYNEKRNGFLKRTKNGTAQN